jgi:hypothetical protein
MRPTELTGQQKLLGLAATAMTSLVAAPAFADPVLDWNQYTIEATKGFDGSTGVGVTLDTNLGTRIEAIESRAVFDAINSIDHFSAGSYYYAANNAGSAAAAAAQAAHDVILAEIPNPSSDATADARWGQVRSWVDSQLTSDLAALRVSANDGGIAAGQAAAVAAIAARAIDNATPPGTTSAGTPYGSQLGPTTNPGLGLWRQSNAGASYVSPTTGAPTGFDAAGNVLPKAGIDLNWRDLKPFSLSTPEVTLLARLVPLAPALDSTEYSAEFNWVSKYGIDQSTVRSADQTAQALYYRQDAEIYANEAARIASAARGLKLDRNAKLFALLDNAIADARIGAWISKYEQKFWRPVTALNADTSGAVTNNYAIKPLAATPAHPANTSGHSSTGASSAEILRAVFGDRISPDGRPVALTSLPWLKGTNNGTGNVELRSVSTFSQLQLETGASRLYLGVHWGYDNLQGQLIGLSVADAILRSNDPAADGVRATDSPASLYNIERTLESRRDLYGLFGRDTADRSGSRP